MCEWVLVCVCVENWPGVLCIRQNNTVLRTENPNEIRKG